jgi:uncharacterized membrane protein
MIRSIFVALLGLLTMDAEACPLCNKQIMEAIYNSQFYPNLLTMLVAFIVLAGIVAILSIMATKQHRTRLAGNPKVHSLSPVPITVAAMILGIGLGGFADGIIFHQVLQTHEMLSNKIPPTDYTGKSVNMFWDGIFHFFCLLVVLAGIILMWRLLSRNDINRSGKLFTAGLFGGWGIFNIVEGIIDHHVLKLHNVIEYATNPDIGNYIFLGISCILLFVAWVLFWQGISGNWFRREGPERIQL